MKESVCDGCERPINECVGYGSCVPRLRSELALALAVVEAGQGVRHYTSGQGHGWAWDEFLAALTAFDAGRKP